MPNTPDEWAKRIRYYKAAARSTGVSPLFLDDAAQDIAIGVWLAGEDTATIVHRRAVDAARVYGPRSRHGVSRETTEIPARHSIPDTAADVIARATVLSLLRGMPRGQRRAVAKRLAGRPMSRTDVSQMGHARRRLRTLLAG